MSLILLKIFLWFENVNYNNNSNDSCVEVRHLLFQTNILRLLFWTDWPICTFSVEFHLSANLDVCQHSVRI